MLFFVQFNWQTTIKQVQTRHTPKQAQSKRELSVRMSCRDFL